MKTVPIAILFLATGFLLAGCAGQPTFTAKGEVTQTKSNEAGFAGCKSGLTAGRASIGLKDKSDPQVFDGTFKPAVDAGGGSMCVWTFTIPNVPAGDGLYQVGTGSTNVPNLSQAELEKGIKITVPPPLP
jgi:hypothetical protein